LKHQIVLSMISLVLCGASSGPNRASRKSHSGPEQRADNGAAQSKRGTGGSNKTQVAGEAAQIAHVDEECLHPALQPARPLAQEGRDGGGNVFECLRIEGGNLIAEAGQP